MIKHIVLFKLKSFENQDIKDRKIAEIKSALLALKNKIDNLISIEVGINCNANEQYDIALNTEFNSMADLASYNTHPDHLSVVKIIKEVVDSRSCVDYEF